MFHVTSCCDDAGVTRDDYTATWFHATASPCCSDDVSSCNPALTRSLLYHNDDYIKHNRLKTKQAIALMVQPLNMINGVNDRKIEDE